MILIQLCCDELHQRLQLGLHPAIHTGVCRRRPRGVVRVELIDLCIENVERIGVPQGAHEFALAFADRLVIETGRQPRRAAGIEIPAHSVRALLIHRIPRADDVALVLAHLLAILILHMAQHQAVFVAGLVKDQCRDGQQRIEPSARLVDGFADELRREKALEQLLIFKRIMELRKRHAAAVVPAVDDLRHPVHGLAALGAGEGDLIDKRLVKL